MAKYLLPGIDKIPLSMSKRIESRNRFSLVEAPGARILICGSLYLAGHILRENG